MSPRLTVTDTDQMTVKMCFTTCADEGFTEGLKGLISSIRMFYPPDEAEIVVFFERRNDYIKAFCHTHSADLHYFDEIDSWRQSLLQDERYLGDTGHFYHERFRVQPDLPHHTDRATMGVDRVHHLHPLNVKAHCTAYCGCILDADIIVHIDSDAFLLSRIDELFVRHPETNTVITFDDGGEDLPHLELLYGVIKPEEFDSNLYGFNAGIVIYRNGPGVKELMKDFCFYIDSCYHYTYSGNFADQGVLRALVAKHHILGNIGYIKIEGTNWNPTWRRADQLSFDSDRQRWINGSNGLEQFIWHGAGGAKLWTGKYTSPGVNAAWKWIGGTNDPGPYDQIKGSLIKSHCQLACHAIIEHFRASGRQSLRLLEIGTQYGRTSVAFCAILEAEGIECRIDTFDIYSPSPDYPTEHATQAEAQHNVNSFGLHEKITLHTVESCEDISPYLTQSPDVVFIDGDHRYKHVVADCVVASRVVANDGIILGDDFQIDSVRNAVWTVFGRENVAALNESIWAIAADSDSFKSSFCSLAESILPDPPDAS